MIRTAAECEAIGNPEVNPLLHQLNAIGHCYDTMLVDWLARRCLHIKWL